MAFQRRTLSPSERALLDFIGKHEAPKGYDQIYSRVSPSDYPTKPLTQMTLDEVIGWGQALKPKYRSRAAGQYQFMDYTLADLKDRYGLTGKEVFDSDFQDQLAAIKLRERGYDDWQSGKLNDDEFGNRLAQEWAILPVLSGTKAGRSFYDGDGVNSTKMKTDKFMSALIAARGAVADPFPAPLPVTPAPAVGVLARFLEMLLRLLK